jgi:outer membrane protein OmpA-like peptidoglycan-associated protein
MLHYFKYLTFIVLISCSSQRSLAQTDGSKKAQEIYAKANEDLVFGRYQEALSGFELAVKTDPSYINAHLQIANLYQNLYNLYDQAVGHYEAVIKLDKTLYKSYYEAGQCYLSMLDYVNAEKNTSLYLEKAELSANGKWQANLLMESIKFAKAAVMNPVVYEPKNLGPSINSEKAEYFPSITADNEWLYFTINDMSQKYPNEDIYAAQFIDGQWQKRIPVKGVNGFDSQEGAHSITQDGRYLFFASDRMEGNLGRFDLYIAKKVGDEWEKPMNMGNVVNTRHWESQPVISANSKQIFLVRKSNDGFGGSDIYVSNLGEEGKFGSPVNLGNVINTPGDEQRPYLHPDGKTLYFASNGHPGMGKTDVFKSILQADGAWSVPQNLGYPLNSVEMEYGLYVASDGKTAYIASDRAGGFGDMDIYSFIMPESARPALVLSVKGVVKDVTTLNGLKANIKIIEIESGEIYKTLSSDEINGSFLITLAAGKNYVYQATAEGYLPYSENFSLTLQNPKEILQLVALMQRIEQGKEFTLKNIFFDTGEYQLLEESKAELNLLVDFIKKDERLFLEVGGHTDSDGAIENNLVLSEKRAKAVQDYLISQGVAQNRLTFKGYGESAPLFPNDTEANKAKNRRTAFKVL